MVPARKKKTKPGNYTNAELKSYVQEGASPYVISWAILGGKEFMPNEPVSGFDFLTASSKGITKQSIVNLADIMEIPMKDFATLLNVSYKTLGRKRKTDLLDSLASSLSIEIANTFAHGLAVFEDQHKLNRWLNKENRALENKKPMELLNTPTGIRMVNAVLARLEEGIYT